LLPRLPITLWRHTLGDLLKLIALSTSVLVLVIALGAAVKPLSDGVLQPQDLLKFIGIAVVPMLAYALPFAGGFASTLVYHRIAQENEAVAAHAGGISHRSLLAPAFLTAALLTGMLLLLNEQVIPVFLRQMAKLITVDVARQITRGIEKGQAVQLKGSQGSIESRLMIYADSAMAVRPTPESGATDQVDFTNFAAVELDKEHQPVTEVTAEKATLWLYPDSAVVVRDSKDSEETTQALIFMRLNNVVVVRQGQAQGRAENVVDISRTVPDTFNEKVAYMSLSDIRGLKDNPERIPWIEFNRKLVAYALAEREAIASARRDIGAGNAITFTDSAGHPLTLRAGAITGAPGRWELTPAPGKTIDVERYRSTATGESHEFISAQRAVLKNDPASGPHRLEFELALEKARVRGTTGGAAAEQTELAVVTVTGLTPSPNPVTPMLEKKVSSRELVAQADESLKGEPSPDLSKRRGELSKMLAKLTNVILSQQNERLAMAVSCAVMVLTGAMTALLLSRRLPLTVYLWTFFPAIASMVTISGGQQATTASGPAGLILMWSGVGGLALYSLIVFRWLSRH
jgi:lipopolysaccharide export LptBFGC system permease protein LptF